MGYPIDQDGKAIIPQDIKDRCLAKGEVTLFAYSNRDKLTLSETLEVFEREWNDVWSQNPNISWATHVDMERIIRDAYRTDSTGSYKRECCTEEVIDAQALHEMQQCVYRLHF